MKRIKGLLGEFREFAFKNNAVELAIGVIIGSAFNKIVNGLVQDIMMPVIQIVTVGLNTKKYTFPPFLMFKLQFPKLKIADFFSIVINSLIIAASVFFIVKVINKLHKNDEEQKKLTDSARTAALLEEIRDLLKEQQHKGGAE